MGLEFLWTGIAAITWKEIIMYCVGIFLIYLAIAKKLEPTLLLPMGFGAILVNIPFSGALTQGDTIGAIEWLFEVGIHVSEILPLLLFIGIGAMLDFGPLLASPKLIFIGAAAQAGIFATIIIATLCGYDIKEAASIGIIGAADGPTSILVSGQLLSADNNIRGAITVAAYCYMALVPIIQPFVIKLCTTKKERLIKMEYNPQNVSKGTKIVFPVIITLLAGLLAPASVSLVGFLMFGNLIKECGVLDSLSETASKTLTNLVTLLLGITISFTMVADKFVHVDTLIVMGLGLLAFSFDTFFGIFFVKFINLFSKKKINPMVGAAGISAFPMASRIVHQLGVKEDKSNYLLMHAASANIAGQVASAIAGGVILSLFL
jgi:oxaloacetate decarboxylase beta subunit